ncbi:MAG: dephospho-CoA kinase, partial [bacterium]
RVREAEVEIARGWNESGATVGVIDAALLVETGAHLRFSRLVVVHCPAGVQRARLMSRDGLDAGAAEARLRAQMPIDDKRWFGHLDVDTSGRLDDTDAQATRLAVTLRELADTVPSREPWRQERLLGAVAHGASRGPGGISPTLLLEEIAAARGSLDLARLLDRLEPPVRGAWDERRPALPGPGPQALAPALAAWCAVDGRDGEQAATAMGSLARLVGASSTDAAAAVFLAVAFLDLIRASGPLTVATESAEAWGRLAERWGAGTAPDTVAGLLARLAFLPGPPAAARRLAEGHGWDADAAAALASLRAGARPEDAPALANALERIAAGVQ